MNKDKDNDPNENENETQPEEIGKGTDKGNPPLPIIPSSLQKSAQEKEPDTKEKVNPEDKTGPAPSPHFPTEPTTEQKPGFTTLFESLLKNPRDIISGFVADPGHKTALKLAGSALVCLLGFGFVIGTMSGGHQLWAAPLKVSGGLLISALICLPSLYIFACLTGLNLRPSALAGLLAAGVCLAALLLVGFAPVAWLFGQSTDSTLFYGVLCLAFWGIALYFAFGLIRQTITLFAVAKPHHLYIWCGIFALVTIQMSTSLRPIIGTAENFLPGEKKFFLEHWFAEIKDAGKPTRTPVPSEEKTTASR